MRRNRRFERNSRFLSHTTGTRKDISSKPKTLFPSEKFHLLNQFGRYEIPRTTHFFQFVENDLNEILTCDVDVYLDNRYRRPKEIFGNLLGYRFFDGKNFRLDLKTSEVLGTEVGRGIRSRDSFGPSPQSHVIVMNDCLIFATHIERKPCLLCYSLSAVLEKGEENEKNKKLLVEKFELESLKASRFGVSKLKKFDGNRGIFTLIVEDEVRFYEFDGEKIKFIDIVQVEQRIYDYLKVGDRWIVVVGSKGNDGPEDGEVTLNLIDCEKFKGIGKYEMGKEMYDDRYSRRVNYSRLCTNGDLYENSFFLYNTDKCIKFLVNEEDGKIERVKEVKFDFKLSYIQAFKELLFVTCLDKKKLRVYKNEELITQEQDVFDDGNIEFSVDCLENYIKVFRESKVLMVYKKFVQGKFQAKRAIRRMRNVNCGEVYFLKIGEENDDMKERVLYLSEMEEEGIDMKVKIGNNKEFNVAKSLLL